MLVLGLKRSLRWRADALVQIDSLESDYHIYSTCKRHPTQNVMANIQSAVLSTSEVAIVGSLNFHDLARIIAASCTLIATVLSLYLVWMHALHYTKPREQRQ